MAVKKSNLLSLFFFVMMLLAVLAANKTAVADNVAQVQTVKFFDPVTVIDSSSLSYTTTKFMLSYSFPYHNLNLKQRGSL